VTAQSSEVCDKCGAPMVVLTIGANKFLGCSRYPECRNTRSIGTGVHCPNKGCEGMLVRRSTRRGKVFYGCNKYPSCTFATWDEPVARPCEKCAFPILVRRESRTKGTRLRCPNCRTEYPVEPAPGEGEAAAESNGSADGAA
jgi:DNA topoisomerase-1